MKFLINPLSACIGQAMGLCQQNLDIYDFGILIIFCRKLEIISALGGSTLVGAWGFDGYYTSISFKNNKNI